MMSCLAIFQHRVLVTSVLLCLFNIIAHRAHALDESFDLYLPPQVAAMGKAISADASGYLSNYYNPAGLAKATRRRVEVNLFDLEGNFGMGGLGRAIGARSFGISKLFSSMLSNPNAYTYFSFAALSSVAVRNFSFSFLGAYRYAAISDGTSIDLDSSYDLSPSVGTAFNFWGNRLKIGAVARAIIRNQIKGNYPASAFVHEDDYLNYSTEGLAFGGDLGTMLTLPYKYLPTFALVWRDVLNTRFSHFTLMNPRQIGVPSSIKQSVNFATSFHPYLAKGIMGTFSFEVKHLEDNTIALPKRLHIGFQLEDSRRFFVWAGLNQLIIPCFGFGLRVPGGNLELATYGEDILSGDDRASDRRVMFRYTVGW